MSIFLARSGLLSGLPIFILPLCCLFPVQWTGWSFKSIESDNTTLLKTFLRSWNKTWINCHHLHGSTVMSLACSLSWSFALLSLIHSALAALPRLVKISSPRYIKLVLPAHLGTSCSLCLQCCSPELCMVGPFVFSGFGLHLLQESSSVFQCGGAPVLLQHPVLFSS